MIAYLPELAKHLFILVRLSVLISYCLGGVSGMVSLPQHIKFKNMRKNARNRVQVIDRYVGWLDVLLLQS